jgi:hypothetical protein
MKNRPTNSGESPQTASDANAFVENAANAVTPTNSVVGRVGAAATAAQIGVRLLPAGWRMLKRYPLASTAAIAALVYVAYLARPGRGPNLKFSR